MRQAEGSAKTINVLFVYKGDRRKLLSESQDRRAPVEFLYGLPYLDPAKFKTEFVDDPEPFRHISEKIWMPFQRWFAHRFSIGFNFHSYWKNRDKIKAADVIVTTADSYGLPVIWQKYRGKIHSKVVYISQGLYKVAENCDKSKLNEKIRRKIGRWLESVELIVVFGEGDANALEKHFGDISKLNVKVILFGIDDTFWVPRKADTTRNMADSAYILSVGSDSLRDYSLLLKAIGDRPLRIVTRRRLDPALLKPNVVVNGDVDWLELRRLYERARFVVIPIADEPRNSGHSATVQAMACGKAVILSETAGPCDRQGMKHLESCYLVPPGRIFELREAIEYLESNPEEAARIGRNARTLVEQRYSCRLFGEKLQEQILNVLQGRLPDRQKNTLLA